MNMKRFFLGLATTVGMLPTAFYGCSADQDDVKRDPSALTIPPEEAVSGAVDDGDWTCPDGTRGSKMVLIPVPDETPYCIDQRLTVYGEYKAFVEEKGDDFSALPKRCEDKKTFVPLVYRHPGGCPELPCGPKLDEANPDHAVRCVDFCDAWAFCSWAGKRLCGLRWEDHSTVKVFEGESTYENSVYVGEIASSTRSEWFNVCTQGGTTLHPFGNTPQPGVCSDYARDYSIWDGAFAIGDTTRNECRGTVPPYDGVYDMVGLIAQWQNICYSDGYRCIGHGLDGRAASCNQALISELVTGQRDVFGIRCCADPVKAKRGTIDE